MLGFLGPKGLRAEVSEGIDLEQGVTLAGQRITIGSGPADNLRLGAADIVPGHLTLERRQDGSGWDYFSSDRGVTQVDKGNPRTGAVRPGMWIRLGRETRIDLVRTAIAVDDDFTPTKGSADAVPTTVPMPVALGILGAIGFVALVAGLGLGGGSSGGENGLETNRWVSGASDLSPALDDCLDGTHQAARAVQSDDPASAFWRVVAYRGNDPAQATVAEAELTRQVADILAASHLLYQESKYLEASTHLRRLENVLPVGQVDCPILDASRYDLALLELLGSR